MKPSEKAKEIYDQMKGFRVKNSHRKKCALVCVWQIIDADLFIEADENIEDHQKYWLEVKSEIEKM